MNSSLPSANRDHAKNLVGEAVSFYRSAGKQMALAEFMNPRGQFIREDLYVFALDLDGTMLAHPLDHRLIWVNLMDFCDSDGKAFIREIVDVARRGLSGFTRYSWFDLRSQKKLPKMIYYQIIESVIVCAGFYHTGENVSDGRPLPEDRYPENFFDLLEYLGA